MSCELQRRQVECMIFFLCARRAENFQKFCNSYGAILSTPNARNFAMLRNVDSVNPSDVSLNMRSARCLDPRTFCAPRAVSDFFKIFNFFRVTSAENLRDIDANGALIRIWTHFRLF